MAYKISRDGNGRLVFHSDSIENYQKEYFRRMLVDTLRRIYHNKKNGNMQAAIPKTTERFFSDYLGADGSTSPI